MAEQDIIQNLISRLGQSQADRLPAELGRHFVDVDERTPLDLLSHLAALAKSIQFYSQDPTTPDGNWSSFFPPCDKLSEVLESQDGDVTPHLGLLVAFLRLYDQFPRQAINALTGKHLDFQFQRVLQFVPRPAQPDRAHLLVELKKGAPPVAVTSGQEFSAGKDNRGGELVYQAVRDVVINGGQVVELKSIFHDGSRLRFAPQANSNDGLSAPLDKELPKWSPFGHANLPDAHIGFALASPVLRMAEGTRTIHVELQLAGLDPQRHTASVLADSFTAFVSGPKGWIEAQSLAALRSGNRLTLTATISSTQPAIVDYAAAEHGHAFAAQTPVLQILFRQDGPLRYRELAGVTLSTARIRVDVDALTGVEVESDFGKLSAKKAFQPFGPQPVVGSRFLIGCEEALSKRLRQLEVKLTWQGAPPNLYAWYQGYKNRVQMRNGVSAQVVYQDRSGQTKETTQTLIANGSTAESTLSVEGPPPVAAPYDNKTDVQLFALAAADASVLRNVGLSFSRRFPIHFRRTFPAPAVRTGFITIALSEDFLHADFRRETIANAVAPSTPPTILNEPYTPTVQAISLRYEAESDEVDVNDDSLEGFANRDLQFFQVGCFGQMREHAYARGQFAFLPDRRVSLLPQHEYEGEFLIGVRGVGPGDSLSLLLQAAEGSGDPDLPPQQLGWSVLCDNYWRPLTQAELALDTSRGLRTSGIVALALPAETTISHSIMPTGLVWLRATIPAHNGSACQLVHVANNAVEVRFFDRGNDLEHLSAALPAKRITKLKTPLAAIKSVTQPFASFGGRSPETDEMLTRRAAERLRHRQRCLTAWDYERMVLEEFPTVHKVKCIPHASDTSWLAPGHVMLVVVPDLRNQNAADPLRPRIDTGTLSQIAEFVQQHCGMQMQILVKNPRYQKVKVSCLVQFRPGLPFNSYRRQLDAALVRVLSPWAFDTAGPIDFGGTVYRSVLLNFVEELPYVDFVTDFKLTAPSSVSPSLDQPSIQAETPDAVLVSDASHAIDEYKES